MGLQLQSQGQRGLAVAVWNISFVVLQIQDSLLTVGSEGTTGLVLYGIVRSLKGERARSGE